MDKIKVGQVWIHNKSGNSYRVKCVNMKFKDSNNIWVDGVLYEPMYDSEWECFVRNVDNFISSFTLKS